MKLADVDSTMLRYRLENNDHRHKREIDKDMQSQQLQAELWNNRDSRLHNERMYALSHIDTITDAHERAAVGRHQRMMDLKQYNDERQQQAWAVTQATPVIAGIRAENALLNTFKEFGLPESAVEDTDTPTRTHARLFGKKGSPYYQYSILFTGVHKMHCYNPYDPYVVYTDKRKEMLPHGIDGYVCHPEKRRSDIWVVHVYKYTEECIKDLHRKEYLKYLLCCNSTCDVV